MAEQIREKIEYIFRREALAKYMDIAFLVCFAVFLWIRTVSYSSITEPFPEGFVSGFRLFAIGVVFLRFLVRGDEEEEKSRWTGAIIAATLFCIIWTVSYNTVYLDLAIMLLGSVGISYRTTLKIYAADLCVGILFCLLAAFLGLGTDVVSVDAVSRELLTIVPKTVEDYSAAAYYHSLGFVNAEALGRTLFSVCLALWLINRQTEGFWFSGLFAIGAAGNFFLTGDLRTSLIFVAAAVLSAVIYIMNTRKYWKTKESMNIRKYMIMVVRCFALACIFSYLFLTILLLILGGGDYLPALLGNGFGAIALFVIHFLLYKKARREKNGALMIASCLPLLYGMSTAFLADPYNDIFLLFLFTDLYAKGNEAEQEEAASQKRTARRKMFRRMGLVAGAVVVVLALIPTFGNLANVRTMISYLNGRDHMLLSCLALTAYVGVILGIAWGILQLVGNIGRRTGLGGNLPVLIGLVGIYAVVQILPSAVSGKATERYLTAVEQEEDIITNLAKLCDDTGVVMYVSDVPKLYKDQFTYVKDSLFLNNYLAKKENVILVARSDEKYQELLDAGYFHTMISEEHAIYSNSEWAWQLLEGEGYVKANCYSGFTDVDLEEMAEKNELVCNKQGVLVVGSEESMWQGPGVYWKAGVYRVNVKIKWIGGSVVESAGARLALSNPMNGDSGGIVIYHGNEIRNQEEVILTTTFVQAKDGFRDIQVSSFDDVKFWVEEISWQQLWMTEN